MKAFVIRMDNPSGSFFAGQIVTGKVILDLDVERKTSGLKLKCTGKSVVKWTESVHESTGTGSNRTTRLKTITYSDTDIYFDNKVYLIASTDRSDIRIPPGYQEYPFTFQLPLGIPSSFKGQYGYVQYSLEATLKKSWGFDKTTSTIFTVNGVVDLNTYAGARSPSHISKSKHLGCFCCKDGPISFNFKLHRQGFVPGEPLQFTIEMSNMSSVPVSRIELRLYKNVGFHARGKTKHQSIKVIEFEGPGVEAGDTEIWQGSNRIRIPSLPPTNLGGCRIITVNYLLKVEMEIPNGFNLKGSVPIVIGTVPFRTDFQYMQPGFDSSWPGQFFPSPQPPTSSQVSPNAPPSILVNGYPDLPPPTYEEAFSGGVIGLPTYSEATGGNSENNDKAPSAPFDPNFVPKYATYGWNTNTPT